MLANFFHPSHVLCVITNETQNNMFRARIDVCLEPRADVVLCVDDRPVLVGRKDAARSHPLGSLFEQALLVVLDQIVLSLMERLELSESDLARIHTTFE